MGALRNLALVGALMLSAAPAVAQSAAGPARFTPEGALIPPADYREWVFLSSGLDMSYSDASATPGPSTFDNVFVDPASWSAFKAAGHWPDGAVFVLEARGASSHGSINKHGAFQTGDRMALEAHVRDEKRFKGGWGFFDLSKGAPAQAIPYRAACYACHQAHGAVDTTFTQFYPTAKSIAVRAGTYHEP